jgi:hypothetical protein
VGTLTAGAIGTGFTPIPNSALANSGLTINGTAVSLGGSATIAAAAATLTGSTLAAGVTESSLTSVGTLTNLTVTNPISGSVTGNAGTVTNGVVTTGSYSDPAWITALAGSKITGGIGGNAATATALQVARTINGVSFDGTANITVPAAAGTLTGNTLASGVTASSLTSVGTLANLTVTNPISGSVTGSSGSTTGNASTATALQTARNINGVSFNGTADITVAAAASTLTGTTLAPGVTASSLTSVGTLTSLTVTNASSAAPFAVNSNNANGVYYDLTNAQNSGSFRLAVYGSTAFGVAALVSRAAVESTTPNGLVIGAVTSGANGGPIEFHTGFRVLRWSIGATTGHLLAGVDNTYDIGASGATRPRDLYLGRNMVGAGWVRTGAASAGAASTTTFGSTTSTTVGATGAASALPANPLGYLVAHVGTTEVRIPYYNA